MATAETLSNATAKSRQSSATLTTSKTPPKTWEYKSKYVFYEALSQILSKQVCQAIQMFGTMGEQDVLEALDYHEDKDSTGSETLENSIY